MKKVRVDLFAKIKGIKYNPILCRDLKIFDINKLDGAIESCASFILNIDKEKQVAVSWWVSAKRTRSYPYARVYDTLGYLGKRITIIPIFKDEGKEGDRDFLQWDTISLMSLLGVYVIIGYYNEANRSTRYRNKITNQRFDSEYLKEQICNIVHYQSDALHWNLSHVEKAGEIGIKALESYKILSKNLKVEMHSFQSAKARVNQLARGKDEFMKMSRKLAIEAQKREKSTIQPKEYLNGTKATITIKNYLGGYYYFTADEIKIIDDNVFIIEGKHSRKDSLPSLIDIKDGLLKMILFTNLEEVKIEEKKYKPIAALKLTVKGGFSEKNLSVSQKENLSRLKKEANINNFKIIIS